MSVGSFQTESCRFAFSYAFFNHFSFYEKGEGWEPRERRATMAALCNFTFLIFFFIKIEHEGQ